MHVLIMQNSFSLKEAFDSCQQPPKIEHFLFARRGERDDIYQFALDSGWCMSCCL